MTYTRHEQRKAATRQSLLDAARDVIAAKGYNNVEILDITDYANVSKATFYKHFPNKEACVRDLIEQGFDALLAQVFSVKSDDPISLEWVLNTLQQVFRWAGEHRKFLLLMVGGAASPRLNTFGRNYLADVVERTLVAEVKKQADKEPFLPTLIQAQVITGIMIQLLGWWLENDTPYSADEMAQMTVEAIHNGVAPHLR
jgi:AcrR family transcriptional regulator